MSDTIIKVENVSKRYRLGLIGGKTLREDMQRWWAKWRGKPDPLKVDQIQSLNVERSTLNEKTKSDRDSFNVQRPTPNGSMGRSCNVQRSTCNDSIDLWALKDVSFEVKRGEILGIIGRNGAGKSTLLKILSRITAPTSGEIKIRGRVGSLLEVGTGFHPELTGRENIYLNGSILGMTKSEIDKKFNEIANFAEIVKFIDTPVKRYSSGMYVRLAFAVAAHLDPEILVVDEVLAVGDVAFQKKCLGKMDEVARAGRTVLFVSHNMAAISALCTRAFLLSGGTFIFAGEPRAAIGTYLHNGSGRTEMNGSIDLFHRENPCSAGQAIIRHLCLRNSSGAVSSQFLMGESFTAEICIKDISSYPMAVIGLAIESIEGTRVFGTHSAMTGWLHFDDTKSAYQLAVCYIPKIPLTPGLYRISVSLARNMREYLDRVEQAAQIEVLENDIYGTGFEVTRDYGYVYVDGTWSLHNSTDYKNDLSTREA